MEKQIGEVYSKFDKNTSLAPKQTRHKIESRLPGRPPKHTKGKIGYMTLTTKHTKSSSKKNPVGRPRKHN